MLHFDCAPPTRRFDEACTRSNKRAGFKHTPTMVIQATQIEAAGMLICGVAAPRAPFCGMHAAMAALILPSAAPQALDAEYCISPSSSSATRNFSVTMKRKTPRSIRLFSAMTA